MTLPVSALDTQRFGFEIAKLHAPAVSDIERLQDRSHTGSVRLVIVRCPSSDIVAKHAVESMGGRLMDTVVYYGRQLSAEAEIPQPSHPSDFEVVRFDPGMTEDIVEITREGFAGYFGHYHADPRLDVALCDEIYIDWSRRSCQVPGVADEILVARDGSTALGYMTVKIDPEQTAHAILAAVSAIARGRGVYRAMAREAVTWAAQRGASRISTSTQLENTAVQRAWIPFGLRLSHAEQTFHIWL